MKRILMTVTLSLIVFSGNAFGQAGAPAKVIPIERLQTAKLASTDYPSKAGAVRSVIPGPLTGDRTFDAKTQKLASNYEKELGRLDAVMQAVSVELRRDQADRKKLSGLSRKVEGHMKALKKKHSELKTHLTGAITSEKSGRPAVTAAYESFDRKAGELYGIISTIGNNMKGL
ncbi:MAG TPA: hypothetical protein PLR20_05920 [Syntrophales bacterium]|nr:hypothetical protein [Syntrophales bacterium]HOX94806.1 hypothetical protein [Syntrophales bacterium]HPI57956.1 hypothetical protein [Syntrophales bacterium]HPN24565.1 hypothetical protein [Syntrophales bacterium]HQM28871.1 hypothetical protein [Syntrophales bacterium]